MMTKDFAKGFSKFLLSVRSFLGVYLFPSMSWEYNMIRSEADNEPFVTYSSVAQVPCPMACMSNKLLMI